MEWTEYIKSIEENICKTLQDLEFKGLFKDMIPLAKTRETKINKWNRIRFKKKKSSWQKKCGLKIKATLWGENICSEYIKG